MKHQVFFFVLLCSSSTYSMDIRTRNVLKSLIINRLTDYNYDMKQEHNPDHDMIKIRGQVITWLRANEPSENDIEKFLEVIQNLPNPAEREFNYPLKKSGYEEAIKSNY